MRTAGNAVVLVLMAALGAREVLALDPADVAVVFNTKSPSSVQVARYYLNARHLPQDHLIPLTCDVGENISEFQYRTSVVPQLKKALADRKLLPDTKAGTDGIRCLVTTYDVPLRITAHELTVVEKAEVADYEKRLDGIAEDLANQIKTFDNLAKTPLNPAKNADSAPKPASQPAEPTPKSAPATRPGTTSAPLPTTATALTKPTWSQVLAKVQEAAKSAAQRIDKLGEPERSTAGRQFVATLEHVAGPAAEMTWLAVPPDAPNAEDARQRLADLGAQVRATREQIQALMPQRDSARIRQEIVTQHLKIEGVAGEAAALEEMIRYVRPEQTAACFDSELALLLADQSYPREGALVNPKSLDAYARTRQAATGSVPATLMVCRLDGSTPAKVQEMIDTGLKVEAKGLTGKMYINARGLHGTDGYALFDDELRRTATWMKAHSTMTTMLEDTGELLQAKDAPEAAVYCGWYSLNNYQDSGQWVKGAVGYHVASFEMMSLHNPAERGWVVNLLNHGFCGTLGPTDEPYLQAFPKPSQFFPLLLSGEFTQGEVWELTCPSLSWRIGYVGDPLYNPFKATPAVMAKDLRGDAVLRLAYDIENRK